MYVVLIARLGYLGFLVLSWKRVAIVQVQRVNLLSEIWPLIIVYFLPSLLSAMISHTN